MKSKKILSIVISTSLLFSSALPAFAYSNNQMTNTKIVVKEKIDNTIKQEEKQTKMSEEEAKNIAIKYLKETFGVELTENLYLKSELVKDFHYENNSIWDFNWYNFNSKLYRNINIYIDSKTGKLLSVYINESDQDEKKKIATITKEDAQKIALKFLNETNPDEIKELDLKHFHLDTIINTSPRYSFIFNRSVNGVEVLGNMIYIGIDGISGKITRYDYNWDDKIVMPSKDGIISAEKAKKQLENNTDMYLYYILPEDKNNKAACGKLIYTFNYKKNFMVDAKTGKIIETNIKSDAKDKIIDLSPNEKAELYKIASKNNKVYTKEISKNQAKVDAENFIKGIYGKNIKIESIESESVYSYEEVSLKAWVASFSDDKHNFMGNVKIDAENGAFLSLNTYGENDDYKDFEPIVTFKEAHKNILEIIAKYFPEKIKNIDTKQRESVVHSSIDGIEIQPREYDFYFERVENGVTVRNNNISGSFNMKTGKLANLRIDWNDNAKLPKMKEAISKEEAKKLLAEKYEAVLRYTNINTITDKDNPVIKGNLIYKLEEKSDLSDLSGIDAVTSRYVDFEGNEIIKDTDSFENKISLSKYKKEISLLANSEIIDSTTFELNSKTSRIDLIKMLVNTKENTRYISDELEELKFKCNIDKSNEDYKTLQLAVYYSFIDNENKEIDFSEKLNREETAKILVKALGYEKLSKKKDYFVMDCKDANEISDDAVGSAVICRALGIMELNNGKFEPKEKITMEELSKIIYNMIVQL